MKALLTIIILLSLCLSVLGQDSLNVRWLGHMLYDQWYQARSLVVQGNYVYAATGRTGLRIADISTPATPVELGYFVPEGSPPNIEDVAVAGSYAYALTTSGLYVVNVADPSAPLVEGFCSMPEGGHGVVVSGVRAYIACGTHGLRIIVVSHPWDPNEQGFIDTPGYANDVAVSGNYAYVADGQSGLRVIDISTPSAPVEVGFYNAPGDAHGVTISGSYAYVADGFSGLRIIDISDPAAPF
jgi:hypothetical protein